MNPMATAMMMSMMSGVDGEEEKKKSVGFTGSIMLCCIIIFLIIMFIAIGIFGLKFYKDKKKSDLKKAKIKYKIEQERISVLINNEEEKKKIMTQKMTDFENKKPCANPKYFKDESTNYECLLKQCSCNNGLKATGMYCPKNGNEWCLTCNDGYNLTSENTCKKNVCLCENGIPAVNEKCFDDQDKTCESCDEGHDLTKGLECKLTTCDCPNGEPETGIDCPKNNELLCKSCIEGHYLEKCLKAKKYIIRYNDDPNKLQEDNINDNTINHFKLNLPRGWSPNQCCIYIEPKRNYPKYDTQQKLKIVDGPGISDRIKELDWYIIEYNKQETGFTINEEGKMVPEDKWNGNINYKLCTILDDGFKSASSDDNSCFNYENDLASHMNQQVEGSEDTKVSIIKG